MLPARPLAAAALLLAAALTLPSCAAEPAGGTIGEPASTATPDAEPGSRDDPLPLGTTVLTGRWQIVLGPVAWLQRDEVVTANAVPALQPEGYGWALVPITYVNRGDDHASPGQFEVILHAGGWDVSHREVGRHLTRMPAEFHPTELDRGASITGNLGFWLPDTAAADTACLIELHEFPGDSGRAPRCSGSRAPDRRAHVGMTIDAHGNAHHPAGSLSGGQFASRANGAPTTPLTEPAPRTHDVILAEALRIGKIGARRPAGVDDPHLDDVRQVLWWSIHFRADPPATRTPREIHAELGGIEELTTPAIAETHAAMDHALRWVLGETDHPFRS